MHKNDALKLIAVAGVCVAAFAFAGPLSPSAGPVASTYKTLTEVEPRIAINAANTPGDANNVFKITKPGSYYLTGDVAGIAGKNGIDVGAINVTIDLSGYTLAGPGAGATIGIRTSAPNLGQIRVRNGRLDNWGHGGIDFATADSSNCQLDDVVVSANKGGIAVNMGLFSVLSRCTVTTTLGQGYITGRGASFTECTATANQFTGFSAGPGSLLTRCVASTNGEDGISAGSGSILNDCASSFSGQNGITVSQGSKVSNCTVTASGATGLNLYGSVAIGCVVTGSAGRGLTATDNASVLQCTISSNGLDGMLCNSNVTVRGCSINTNGGDGIFAPDADCRIEDNMLNDNYIGIVTSGARSFVARNTAHGNSGGHYFPGGFSDFAPIVTSPASNNFATMTPYSNVVN